MGIIIRLVFSKDLNVNESFENGCINFKGTLLLLGSNQNDVKIFDPVSMKALTKFSSAEDYSKKVFNYRTFSKYFPMPLLLYNDADKLILIEEYVRYKPYSELGHEDYDYVIRDVFEKNIVYFTSISKESELWVNTPYNIIESISKKDELLDYLWNNIDNSMKKLAFPYVDVHGDLW